MDTKTMLEESQKYIMNTYNRLPVVLVEGKGVNVWDSEGKRYLDMVAGIAVCNLGHSYPAVVNAIEQQVRKLSHVSNIYHIEPQINLARLLVENSFADKAFFCNSGAEANEGAIKLARKYSHDRHGHGRHEIITMLDSFHGRTLATVSATGQEKFQKGFDPMPPGFTYVPFDDLKALETALNDRTCAVMVEPIQGEGGVRVPHEDYLKGLRKLCDERDILLIFDEVQVGMGRTGTLFAYEQTGVEPDIMTLAKALGNGFPVGALLAKERVASHFQPGNHASTFGGNPLAMAAGTAVMESVLTGEVLENVRDVGAYFMSRMEELKSRHDVITDVRGRGLIVGVELATEGGDIVKRAMKRGVLINCTCGNILRFVPPLVISKEEIDVVVNVIDEVIGN